jgi:hypothetical protein
MAKYRVLVNGGNFLIDMDGRIAKYGFYIWRFVEADDPTGAEYAAVEMLRTTQKLREMVRNHRDDPPVMDVSEMVEVESFESELQGTGFVWYEENPKRWWQFWKR